LRFYCVAVFLTIVKIRICIHKEKYKNAINTSTHITETPTQLSNQPKISNPTHTQTYTLQNPYVHTPTLYKNHTYTHPHITRQVIKNTIEDTRIKIDTIQSSNLSKRSP